MSGGSSCPLDQGNAELRGQASRFAQLAGLRVVAAGEGGTGLANSPAMALQNFPCSWISIVTLAVAATGLLGCNLVTGADDLVLSGAAQSPGDGSDGIGGQGVGATGAGATGSGGSGAYQGGETGAPTEPMASTEGVIITDIVVYQSVARPIMQGGSTTSSAIPIVANRDALIRVFYSADGGYNGQPVTARLSFGASSPIEQVETPVGSSSEGTLGSTINFAVPAAQMQSGMTYRVDLLQPVDQVSSDNPAARFPTTEGSFEAIPAQVAGNLTITLVPVQYNGDGSGRLPDTSATQLQRYADLFFGMYPVSGIDVQVRSQPLSWGSTVAAGGNGWSELLNAVADLRSSDGAASNNYYYGIFEPADSFSTYCSGGCVAGLGFVGGPSDSWAHAAIGLGYSGDMAVETAVHELGHNHGREHAPCGVSGDPAYPYPGASIGVYGYDLVHGQLYNPSQFVDMMSYCSPTWISDHNFKAIFDRVKFVNGAQIYTPPELQNRSYERVMVNPDGSLTWLAPIVLSRPPIGDATATTVATVNGPELVTGALIRYDHIDGGVLFIPPTAQPMAPQRAVSAMVDGKWLATGP
ncbi:MAG: hypothetical protein DRI90_28665 [Deltaproteobacteria bacterium]|nr:MAG: hypothetical protein DRI90_28665 [Deltaproteobacteria bacterium]